MFLPPLIISPILICAILIVVLWRYIRRFYYISKFPGPSALPVIGNALMFWVSNPAEVADFILNLPMHIPLFRLWLGWHPIVCTSDPTYIKTILTHPNSLEKGYLLKKFSTPIAGDSILTSTVSKWHHNRKIIIKGFALKYINKFVPEFIRQSEILVQQLRHQVNETNFDLYPFVEKTTLDIVLAAVMGIDLKSQTEESEYFQALNSLINISVNRFLKPLLHFDFIFNRTRAKKEFDAGLKIIWKLIDDVINDRRKSSNEVRDRKQTFLDILMETVEANDQFTDENLKDEVNLLIIAAYDTLSVSICWVIVMLALHPEIQERTYEEVHSTFGNKHFSRENLTNLVYLEMVIKETLRFIPTAPIYFRDVIDDIQLGEFTVPKGTTCGISVYHTHHNETWWPNANVFDPERFSAGCVVHPFAYIPFSAGPRNCIGNRYTMTCLKTVLSHLLLNYTFETDLKIDQLKLNYVLLFRLDDGFLVRIKERKKCT